MGKARRDAGGSYGRLLPEHFKTRVEGLGVSGATPASRGAAAGCQGGGSAFTTTTLAPAQRPPVAGRKRSITEEIGITASAPAPTQKHHRSDDVKTTPTETEILPRLEEQRTQRYDRYSDCYSE